MYSIILKVYTMRYTRFQILSLIIFLSLLVKFFFLQKIFQCSSILPFHQTNSQSHHSTLERSKKALERFQNLLNSLRTSSDHAWIWSPTDEYPSVPYQPTSLRNQTIKVEKLQSIPQSVENEIVRVCQRLIKAHEIHGKHWCQLFRQCYPNTLSTTTSLLDDQTTYIITGDIDLMWLRDSR